MLADGYPEMSSTFKASSMKTLSRYIAAKTQCMCETMCHKVRAVCCWAHWVFARILDSADFYLTDSEIAAAEYAGETMLLAWQWLADNASSEGKRLWFIRPKHHMFEHICNSMRAQRVNPARLACWLDESLMHDIKQLGQKCPGGTRYAWDGTVSTPGLQRLVQRYLLGLAMRSQLRERCGCWLLPMAEPV
eukprot:15288240-Alexandrium_andersonii.AAC.1